MNQAFPPGDSTHQRASHVSAPEHADLFKLFTSRQAEESSKARSPVPMRSFKESEKSQKTVKSMIETKGGDKGKEPGGKKNKNTKKEGMYKPAVFTPENDILNGLLVYFSPDTFVFSSSCS